MRFLYSIWHPVQQWFYSSWWGQDVFAGSILSVAAVVWTHLKRVKDTDFLHEKLNHIIRYHPDIPPLPPVAQTDASVKA